MPKTSLRQLSTTGPVSLFPLVHRKKWKENKKETKKNRKAGRYTCTDSILKKGYTDYAIN